MESCPHSHIYTFPSIASLQETQSCEVMVFICTSCSHFSVLVLVCSGKKEALLQSSWINPKVQPSAYEVVPTILTRLPYSHLLLALQSWHTHLHLSVWGSLCLEHSSPDCHTSHTVIPFRSLPMSYLLEKLSLTISSKMGLSCLPVYPSSFPCCISLQNSNHHLTWYTYTCLIVHYFLLFCVRLGFLKAEAEGRIQIHIEGIFRKNF